MRRLLPYLLSVAAWAQQNPPHLAYVYPAGAQRGTTLRVQVGGQFLNGVTSATITGAGIVVEPIEYRRPMDGMTAAQLREKVRELTKKPEAREEVAAIRRRLATFARNRIPQLEEVEVLEISIDAQAEEGLRELRLVSPRGLSTAVTFCVGLRAEYVEPQTDIKMLVPGLDSAEIAAAFAERRVTLPVTINGRIVPRPARPGNSAAPGGQFTPGDVDRYHFSATRGAQLVAAVEARAMNPYLADAVPGWFQPVIRLLDERGNEVAFSDHWDFRPDPLLHYEIPADGEYSLEIRDALYRGREDFVYRIQLGSIPFLTSIRPLGGRAGAKTTVQATGWNLPARTLTLRLASKSERLPVQVAGSNALLFSVGDLPEAQEREPNDSPKKPQSVKLPITINGSIQKAGDVDVFSFKGRAGDRIAAEVLARRLGSPLDAELRLYDSKGKQIAMNDDTEDPCAGLLTHQADPQLVATLPATGMYFIELRDAQDHGGGDFSYRLRLTPPRPDFRLLVSPSGLNTARGMTIPVTLHLARRDGFDGPVRVAMMDAPMGFVLSGAEIPAGQTVIRATLTVPSNATPGLLPLRFEGQAQIEGHEVAHAGTPADERQQAFAWRHLVPEQSTCLYILPRVVFRAEVRTGQSSPLRLPAGGEVQLKPAVPQLSRLGPARYELSDPPPGLTLERVAGDPAQITIHADPAKLKPGTRGNLIIAITAERPPDPNRPNQPAATRRVPLGLLPALPFEITAP